VEVISKGMRAHKLIPKRRDSGWGAFIGGKEAAEKAAKFWKHKRSRHELAYTVSR
jgi:hypothetical protein